MRMSFAKFTGIACEKIMGLLIHRSVIRFIFFAVKPVESKRDSGSYLLIL